MATCNGWSRARGGVAASAGALQPPGTSIHELGGACYPADARYHSAVDEFDQSYYSY